MNLLASESAGINKTAVIDLTKKVHLSIGPVGPLNVCACINWNCQAIWRTLFFSTEKASLILIHLL